MKTIVLKLIAVAALATVAGAAATRDEPEPPTDGSTDVPTACDPRETGSESPFFQFDAGVFAGANVGGNRSNGACPNGSCPSGVCPNGTCPNGVCPNGSCPNGVCPGVDGETSPSPGSGGLVVDPNVAQTNLAPVRSVVRVRNAFEETVSASTSGSAAGGSRRIVVEKGSGAFVSDSTGAIYVLTAAHIFRDGTGTISATALDGTVYPAKLAFASDDCDVALLRIDSPVSSPALTVSDSWARQGETVWRSGFGPDERLITTTCVVEGYARTARGDAYETLKVDGPARQGDSGGPVFDASGEIVGVVWGTDGTDSYATYSGRIVRALVEYSASFRPASPTVPNASEALDSPKSSKSPEAPATSPKVAAALPSVALPSVGAPDAASRPETPSESTEPPSPRAPEIAAAPPRDVSPKKRRSRERLDSLLRATVGLIAFFAVGYCGALTATAKKST